MKSKCYKIFRTNNSICREFWGEGSSYISATLHRVDGPAYVEYSKDGKKTYEEYHLLNVYVTKEDFYTPGFIDAFIIEHS